ncbi:MAG: indole-3-glycerol-phosphate synthase [Planctomycetes bacterium]|nr:indole-3-glycerol-phosphate synthase [Planctomycetota bacterium]
MSDALSRAIRLQRQRGNLAIIAEVKQRRYGGESLLRGRSAAEIARTYQEAGATAISVVTSSWYGGSMGLLEEVASAGVSLPILRKDLIRNEKAIIETHNAGATAVLLALPLLGLKRLVDLVEIARARSIEPFVEVSNEKEIAELRESYTGVIAINNSDIKTNETEGAGIERSTELIDRQEDRLWVSASRVESPEEVQHLSRAGFDGILIGTSLLSADNLARATRRIVEAAQPAATGSGEAG